MQPGLSKTSEGKAAEVERLIAPLLARLGYEPVRLSLSGESHLKLQVMIDRLDGGTLTVGDCQKISRAIEPLLDEQDPVKSPYVLEVSSPGIDRPLTRLKDFVAYQGHPAKITLLLPQDGQKRFTGEILAVTGDTIKVETEKGVLAFPFAALQKAKLVLTDRLLAKAAAEQAEHNLETQDEG